MSISLPTTSAPVQADAADNVFSLVRVFDHAYNTSEVFDLRAAAAATFPMFERVELISALMLVSGPASTSGRLDFGFIPTNAAYTTVAQQISLLGYRTVAMVYLNETNVIASRLELPATHVFGRELVGLNLFNHAPRGYMRDVDFPNTTAAGTVICHVSFYLTVRCTGRAPGFSLSV